MRNRCLPIALLFAFVLAVGCVRAPAEPPASTPAPGMETSPTRTADSTAAATLDTAVSERAIDEVRAAVEATLAKGTVWINKRVEFAGSSEIPDGATAFAGGQASFEHTRKMRALVQFADTEAGLEASSMEVIWDGTLVYLHGRILTYLVGDGRWLLVDLASDDPRAEPFQVMASGHNDASMALFYLYGAIRVVNVSDGDVHEQPARRYTLEIQLDEAVGALSEEHAEGFRQNLAALRLAGVEPDLTAEVWIGEDGLVHHIDYVQGLGPELGGGSMATSVDFSDFGVPLELDIPEPELVTPIDEVQEPEEPLPRA